MSMNNEVIKSLEINDNYYRELFIYEIRKDGDCDSCPQLDRTLRRCNRFQGRVYFEYDGFTIYELLKNYKDGTIELGYFKQCDACKKLLERELEWIQPKELNLGGVETQE